MFVVAVHQTPSLTQERYEEVVRRLTNGKSRFESAEDLPFDGLIFHVAGSHVHRQVGRPAMPVGATDILAVHK